RHRRHRRVQGMNATHELRGVIPVLQTPFRADETIDFDVLAAEIDWALKQEVDGLAIAMVSEVLRLATDEREQLATAVCQCAAGRKPVVISVGAESSLVAERLAQHAEQAGAAAVMAIP